ncbi:MAG: DUF742 domain-containing protein [Dactylosporangium sp.]|nr:DUF742 domain-containing protein [Dactylosporangium sp.]NNJ61859.1 DUF742 domain-containing protein [Dactylosporangium sp.]
MTDDMWYGHDDGGGGRFVPLYVLVNGRTCPRNTSLDLATQVIALPTDTRPLEPEHREIIYQCESWMSIAEIAAHLDLPLAVAKVLVDILLERGYLAIGSPADKMIADRGLLETILAGLQSL